MGGNIKIRRRSLVLSMLVNGLDKLFGPTKHFLIIFTCSETAYILILLNMGILIMFGVLSCF